MNNTKNKAGRLSTWLLGGALILVGSGLTFTKLAEAKEETKKEKHPPVKVVVDDAPLQRDGKFTTSFAPVVKKVAPSVVNVFTTMKGRELSMSNLPDDPFFRRFFGNPDEEGGRKFHTPRQNGLGSGVIVTEDGYILTNNHVVDNADQIKVALTDGREFSAKVVGRDPKTDIAVLRIEANDLPFIEMTDSGKIEIGDLVLAIGNPFGIGQTVTMGMVSATGRANMGMEYEDFIQTDAAINPGNSGGALVDAQGRLIGINTAILSRSGGNQGIGFAVPVNMARHVMTSLVEKGRVVRGFLGVMIQDVTPALVKQFSLPETHGAVISEVTAGSPAAKAGLKDEDVIVEFSGKPVRDSRHLKLMVSQTDPGSKVPVKFVRDGKEKTLEVQLKELPRSETASKEESEETSTGERLVGVSVSDINDAARKRLNLPENMEGVLVTKVDPDSPAYEAGLRDGDVIREINRQAVKSADEAVELSQKSKDSTILLRVWSRGGTRYLVVDESKKD